MASPHNETEFKYVIKDIDSVRAYLEAGLPRMGILSPGGTGLYIDTYYDTPGSVLLSANFAVRLRKTGQRHRLEIKAEPLKSGGICLSRTEWTLSDTDKGQEVSLQQVQGFFFQEFRYDLDHSLEPIVILRANRQKMDLRVDNGSFEISLDTVSVYKPGSNPGGIPDCAFTELELEWTGENPPSAEVLKSMEDFCTGCPGLVPGGKNKLRRALSMINTESDKLQSGMDSMTSGQSLRFLLKRSWEKAMGRVNGTRIGYDPEFLHDFRVSLRKMRTLIGVYSDYFRAVDFNRLSGGLKWLGNTLGLQRDCDVGMEKLRRYYPAAALAENPQDLALIEKAALALREKAAAVNRALFIGARYKALVHSIDNFLKNDELFRKLPLPDGINGNCSKTAAVRIIKLSVQTMKASARLLKDGEKASDREIHRLRIRFKRLRYMIDFYSGLLPLPVTVLLQTLPVIQDVLGAFVDTFFLTDQAEAISRLLPRNYSNAVAHMILSEMKEMIVSDKSALRTDIMLKVKEFMEGGAFRDSLTALRDLVS